MGAMPNAHDQIDARIRTFVVELGALVRAAALEAVGTALGAPTSSERRPRPAAAPRVARSTVGPRAVGGKRDPKEIARTVDRLRAHIAAHPGHGVEEIDKALALSTAQLALPVKKLLGAKAITRKGVKRATRYFPVST
jgi:hypothetical protein